MAETEQLPVPQSAYSATLWRNLGLDPGSTIMDGGHGQ